MTPVVTDPLGVIPFSNATLTKVEGGGFVEGYGVPAGSDTQRWSGSAAVWIGEELFREVRNGDLNEVSRTYMKLPQSLATGAQRGDTVTFNPGAKTREIRDIKEYDAVGITHFYFTDE